MFFKPYLRSLTLASALCLLSVPANATVLILDANGNYVPAESIKADGFTAAENTPVTDTKDLERVTDDVETAAPQTGEDVSDTADFMNSPEMTRIRNLDVILNEKGRATVVATTANPSTLPLTELAPVTAQRVDGFSSEILSGLPDDIADPNMQAFPAPVLAALPAPVAVTTSADKMPTMAMALPDDPTVQSGVTEFDEIIRTEVAKFDSVDFAFVKSVIEAESNYNVVAISPKGAMGLMQLMPETAKTYGVVNAFSPAENIRAGTAELARLMDLYNNPTLALAAYNAGQGAVETHDGVPPYRETQEYIVRVLTRTFAKREAANRDKAVEVAAEPEVVSEADKKLKPMKVYSFDW